MIVTLRGCVIERPLRLPTVALVLGALPFLVDSGLIDEDSVDHVLHDVFVLRIEDLALPERKDGQEEQDGPHGAHDDGHYEVPNEEAAEVEDVSKDANGRDPPNCADNVSLVL